MKIELKEHTVPKKTAWGTVQKSLNQHIVLIENDETKQMVQCGYVGATHFLPLSGFPQELCDLVAAECTKILGKPVAAGIAPPSLDEIAEMIAAGKSPDDGDAIADLDDEEGDE